MARQVQIRRGTDEEHKNFTGVVGEVTFDTTSNTIRVHDGKTPGGIPVATVDIVAALTGAIMKQQGWTQDTDGSVVLDFGKMQ